MRLNKYLAKCGIGSRRQCDVYIEKGKIKINGIITKDYSYKVKPDDYIQYNNQLLELISSASYILYKPKGYICSRQDNSNRKIIYNLLPENNNLFSVGRLDYNTTGIILLTNNGELCYKLSHPKFNIKKKYYVSTDKKLSNKNLTKIKNGIIIDDNVKVNASISFLGVKNKINIWNVVLTEGKNREIKKIFNYFSIKVIRLHRYEFAGFNLDGISEGKYRKIGLQEIQKLDVYFK